LAPTPKCWRKSFAVTVWNNLRFDLQGNVMNPELLVQHIGGGNQ